MKLYPLLLLVSCSSYDLAGTDSDSADSWNEADTDADTDTDTDTDTDSDTDTDTFDDGYDPEEELAYIKLEPVVVGDHVFIANPDRATLTRVSIDGLGVITEPIGPGPSIMVGAEDQGQVVILDTIVDEVRLVDTVSMEQRTISVRPNLNQLSLSHNGRWAINYHSSAVPAEPDDSGSWSYSEVSVVDVETGGHWPLSVGFEPASLTFSDDSSTAVLVNDSWLIHIDLSGDKPYTQRIQIANTVSPPAAEEVLLTPGGRYAIIRQFATSHLLLVDLSDGSTAELDVGDNPTDLDVTTDGEKAIAVARGSGELWVYTLADPTAEPTVYTLPDDTVIGGIAMSADGSAALLYSTASGRSEFVSWTIDGDDPKAQPFQIHGTVKPIEAVHLSPQGGTALLVHSADDPADIDPDSPYRRAPAITMVDLTDFFANPIRLSAAPEGFSFTEDDQWAFFFQENQPYLEIADLDRLLLDEQTLLSNPAHIGVFPDSTTAYASQAHALGRISFFDASTGAFQTITGFELNSEIEQ